MIGVEPQSRPINSLSDGHHSPSVTAEAHCAGKPQLRGARHQPLKEEEIIMTKSLDKNTGVSVLSLDQLETVSGGARGEVVIIGCTTPRTWPPGTITWNPWIGQPYPLPQPGF
jgi:hypothetical protein